MYAWMEEDHTSYAKKEPSVDTKTTNLRFRAESHEKMEKFIKSYRRLKVSGTNTRSLHIQERGARSPLDSAVVENGETTETILEVQQIFAQNTSKALNAILQIVALQGDCN